jgi:hypothetical protein
MSIPEWNALPTMPGGPVTILGHDVKTTGLLQKLDTYGRKGMSRDSLGKTDGEEIMCDFFALRDIWTDPKSSHFDQLVDEFVEIYRFYLEAVGVDGFRVDTLKHVHREFWEAFTARLRAKVGPERAKRLLMFGEVYDGAAVVCGKYTYPLLYPQKKEPVLDSVLNFQLCFGARDYLRRTRDRWGSPVGLENAIKAIDGPAYNPTPGPDGLSARQKLVNFVENHDGLNRFRVSGVSERANLLANALLYTIEGIPCIYYGTEIALEDKRGNTIGNSETGRLTFIPRGKEEQLKAARDAATFHELAAWPKPGAKPRRSPTARSRPSGSTAGEPKRTTGSSPSRATWRARTARWIRRRPSSWSSTRAPSNPPPVSPETQCASPARPANRSSPPAPTWPCLHRPRQTRQRSHRDRWQSPGRVGRRDHRPPAKCRDLRREEEIGAGGMRSAQNAPSIHPLRSPQRIRLRRRLLRLNPFPSLPNPLPDAHPDHRHDRQREHPLAPTQHDERNHGKHDEHRQSRMRPPDECTLLFAPRHSHPKPREDPPRDGGDAEQRHDDSEHFPVFITNRSDPWEA